MPAVATNLDPQDHADLARFLREASEADRWPLSPRARRLAELLAKVDPAPVAAVTPYPAPKPIGEPSHVLAKRRLDRGKRLLDRAISEVRARRTLMRSREVSSGR